MKVGALLVSKMMAMMMKAMPYHRIHQKHTEPGKHIILTEFTAKNAFGGRVRHTAGGLVDHETCEATLVGIE